MKTFDQIILGGNIASLVTACELSGQGQSVALVAPPAGIGGHFSLFETLGFGYDQGMLLLEFDSYQAQETDLANYSASHLGSSGPYGAFIRDYITSFFEVRQVTEMQVALRGQLIGDYYISNDLTGLPSVFSDEEAKQITAELGQFNLDGPLHAKQKSGSPAYDTATYGEAARSNHGETLHRLLMEPLVKRTTNLGSDDLLARYHRLFWAPLYYPETLSACLDGKSDMRPIEFHHPSGHGLGEISAMLMERIRQTGHCELVTELTSLKESASGWTVNDDMQSHKVVSSLPQDALAKLLDVEYSDLSKSSYLFVFLEVEGNPEFEVLFNAGDSASFFRITNQSRLRDSQDRASFLSVEYNLDLVLAEDPEFVSGEKYLKELEIFFADHAVGPFKPLATKAVELKKKIVFPEPENVRLSHLNSDRLRGLSIESMGPSRGVDSNSLNDQILQALRYVQLSS